jgi:hypothetical protein
MIKYIKKYNKTKQKNPNKIMIFLSRKRKRKKCGEGRAVDVAIIFHEGQNSFKWLQARASSGKNVPATNTLFLEHIKKEFQSCFSFKLNCNTLFFLD